MIQTLAKPKKRNLNREAQQIHNYSCSFQLILDFADSDFR